MTRVFFFFLFFMFYVNLVDFGVLTSNHETTADPSRQSFCRKKSSFKFTFRIVPLSSTNGESHARGERRGNESFKDSVKREIDSWWFVRSSYPRLVCRAKGRALGHAILGNIALEKLWFVSSTVLLVKSKYLLLQDEHYITSLGS